MNRIKNTIKKTIAWINLIVFLYFGCCLDSPSWIPLLICGVTGSYLALYAYCNHWFEGMLDG